MRYVIVGPQGAGKSTFGGYLAEALGTKATDTSAWLVEVEVARQKALVQRYRILPDMLQLIGPVAKTPREDGNVGVEGNVRVEQGWDAKRNRPARELLVALGDAVNSVGNTFLVDRCFDKGDIAIGVRRKNELAEIRSKYPDTVVIYIDREVGAERAKDNLELTSADANIVVRAKDLRGSKMIAGSVVDAVQTHKGAVLGWPSVIFDDEVGDGV